MIKWVYRCSGCHIYPSYGNGVILSWKSLVGKFENPYCGRDVSEWQWKVKPLSVKATGLYSWSSPSITRITSAPKRWIPPPQCLFYPKLNLAGAAPFFISLNRVEPVATVPPAMKASCDKDDLLGVWVIKPCTPCCSGHTHLNVCSVSSHLQLSWHGLDAQPSVNNNINNCNIIVTAIQ